MVKKEKRLTIDVAYFRADKHFPEYEKYFWEGWSLEDENGLPIQFYPKHYNPGGSFHMFINNNGKKNLQIKDILIERVMLLISGTQF